MIRDDVSCLRDDAARTDAALMMLDDDAARLLSPMPPYAAMPIYFRC